MDKKITPKQKLEKIETLLLCHIGDKRDLMSKIQDIIKVR